MEPILVVNTAIAPDAVAALCERVRSVARLAAGRPVVCDVGALVDPDPLALETLVRLQLAARRSGTSICLRGAPPLLVDLLALTGLTTLLPATGRSGIDTNRQIEDREQARVDEEVDSREARP